MDEIEALQYSDMTKKDINIRHVRDPQPLGLHLVYSLQEYKPTEIEKYSNADLTILITNFQNL